MKRALLAGLAGGLAFNLAMLLTFRLTGFGWNGDGFLLNTDWQSAKLIAIWTKLEPLPLVVNRPETILPVLVLFSIGHAFVYRWLAPAWPDGVVPRALRYGGLTFFLTFAFWELFTPVNMFGEPLWLVAIELVFWATIAFAEAFAIAWVMEARAVQSSMTGRRKE